MSDVPNFISPLYAFDRGVAAEQERNRVEAFGAIRRAVEDARKIDRGVFYETDGNVIDYRKAEAALIRRTIRTIIGSPKA